LALLYSFPSFTGLKNVSITAVGAKTSIIVSIESVSAVTTQLSLNTNNAGVTLNGVSVSGQ
jgi:hypothetical protein